MLHVLKMTLRQKYVHKYRQQGKLLGDLVRETRVWPRLCLEGGGELLSLTRDTVEQWKKQFEEPLKPTNTSYMEDAEFDDLREYVHIPHRNH